MTETVAFTVGDYWIYTSPSGREILHKVVAIDVEPKYQHKPGKCVQLMGVDARIPDTIAWPEDILFESYWRPAAPSDVVGKPTAQDRERGVALAEEHGWR